MVAYRPPPHRPVSIVAAIGRCIRSTCGARCVAITRYLATLHPDVLGVDLSPGMLEVARRHAPALNFETGSLTAFPTCDSTWAAIACCYAIIHLNDAERTVAHREFAHVLGIRGVVRRR
jgi:ubiquinone/menaquinone biosynthesis C-methylase UbiE